MTQADADRLAAFDDDADADAARRALAEAVLNPDTHFGTIYLMQKLLDWADPTPDGDSLWLVEALLDADADRLGEVTELFKYGNRRWAAVEKLLDASTDPERLGLVRAVLDTKCYLWQVEAVLNAAPDRLGLVRAVLDALDRLGKVQDMLDADTDAPDRLELVEELINYGEWRWAAVEKLLDASTDPARLALVQAAFAADADRLGLVRAVLAADSLALFTVRALLDARTDPERLGLVRPVLDADELVCSTVRALLDPYFATDATRDLRLIGALLDGDARLWAAVQALYGPGPKEVQP